MIKDDKETVKMDGCDYEIIEWGQGGWFDLFSETPMLDRIYSMLEDDLKLNYNEIKDSSKWFLLD